MTKTRISLLFSVILSSMLFGCASSPPAIPATPAAVTPETPITQPKPEPPPVQETVPTISPILQSLRESMSQNNYPEARLKAHAIIDNAPKSADAAEALRTLAEINIAEAKLGEAQLNADAAYAINPEDTQILLCLARLAIIHEQNDVAVKHLKEAAHLAPQDPVPHIMLANIQLQFLDTERALASAKTAFQLAPQNCNASIVYADALYASRSYPEAIAQYEAAQTQHCKIGEATLKNMAKLYEVHTQNTQKACDAYKRLHEIDANNPYYKASMDYQCNPQAANSSL